MTGSEPLGSGPVRRATELEAARRLLYAPAAPSGALAAYERLVAASPAGSAEVDERADAGPAGPMSAAEVAGRRTDAPGIRRSRDLRRLLTVGVVGTAITGVFAFPPPVPEAVPLPPVTAGQSLVAYSRGHVDGTGPGIISYQPEGYSVFRADGMAIRVDLTCAGIGEVSISAGRRFRFSCGREQASFTKVDRRVVRDPFVVVGTTRGDVVWSVRISTVPLQSVTATRLHCDDCLALPTP